MKLPDGPQGSLLLKMIRWIADPAAFLEQCAQRYGDAFTLWKVGSGYEVFLSHPQVIKEIFTADPSLLEANEGARIFRHLLGDYSLLLIDGEKHQKQRRLLAPPFQGERMRVYGQLICDATEQVINQWRMGEPFLVRSSMQNISLQVILQAVFGLYEGQRLQQLKQLLGSILDYISSPLGVSLFFFQALQKDLGSWSPWGRYLRQKQQVDELIYAEIRQLREQPDPARTDILNLLMSARDEEGQQMTDVELRDELITLLIGGHETTATALSWAFYCVHHLPEVFNRLMKELEGLGANPDPSRISQLPYLTAVCQETLRIYPVVIHAFPRVVKSPLHLMGYQFDPGTELVACTYLTHRREELYPKPDLFKPERFLERQFSPYEYFPFGGGNRRCIGMSMAQFEMKLILATTLSRWQLALVNNRPVQAVRRGVTLSPPANMRMVVTGPSPLTSKSSSALF
jgi:cytochrome P450